MSNATSPNDDLLRDLVERYSADGYTVATDAVLPTDLQDRGTDLILTRGGSIVLVELKRTSEYLPAPGSESSLTKLARDVQKHPNVRLDVVSVPDPMDVVPDAGLIAERVAAVRIIAEQAEGVHVREAALLLATAALEGALMRLLRANEVSLVGKAGAAALAAAAWSEGLVTQEQWDDLQRLIAKRNAVAHGLQPGVSVSREDVDRLAAYATTFASADFEEAIKLAEWFFERYKDPADGVPHDSAEGGYQYVNGGPYNAAEVLEENFPQTQLAVRNLAVEQIESYGYEWVGINDY